MKRITVEVTQNCINRGKIQDGYNCPVANALKKCCNNRLLVCEGGISDEYDDAFSSISIPKKVKTFINKLDHEGKKAVKPFNFQISLPEEWLKPSLLK
jgi:hypothetical protein